MQSRRSHPAPFARSSTTASSCSRKQTRDHAGGHDQPGDARRVDRAIRRPRRARRGCCRASSTAARRTRSAADDRRGARQPRHLADDRGHAAPLSLVCTCLAEDFEPVLALLGDIVMAPSLPETRSRRARARSSPRSGRTTTTRRARGRSADGAALSGRPSLRPAHEGIGRGRRSADARRARCGCIASASRRRADGGRRRRRRAGRAPTTWRRVCFGDWRRRRRRGRFCRRSRRRDRRQRLVIPMMNKAQADIAYGFTTIRARRPGVLRVLADEQRARPVRASAAGWATASASGRGWPTTCPARSTPTSPRGRC